MKRILITFGTRPEAIKMVPLVATLKQSHSLEVKICVTAQHREMLDQVLSLFEVKPDYDLDIMSPGQDLYSVTEKVLTGMKWVLNDYQPDWVLVHGDTTTSFAAALAAFYHGCKIGHVEAGLRTHNLAAPFPEEANRQLTSRLADAHFAPTELCKSNLIKECIAPEKIVVTGNTVIDALLHVRSRLQHNGKYQALLEEIHPNLKANKPVVLITAHRRENFGQPIRSICAAIKSCAEKLPSTLFIYPVHPNPNIKQPVYESLSNIGNILLIEPLDYERQVCLMDRATLIMTDSGGIQEEAPTFGKKVLVLREVTERQEALEAGVVDLVGANYSLIVKKVMELISDPVLITHNPFGDGKASERISEHLLILSAN